MGDHLGDRQGHEIGQAVVEFALILPLVLLLLVAVADFARVYTTAITLEAAAREAAMSGSFQGSDWLDVNVGTPGTGTIATMEQRACAAASNLPEYAGASGNATCSNPTFVVNGPFTDPSQIHTQADAIAAGVLLNPGSQTDCANPTSTAAACQVHVRLSYQFHMILGGVGIPGLFQFPSTLTIGRDVTFAVNDFPQAGS